MSFFLSALSALGLITWYLLSEQSLILLSVAVVAWLVSVMAATCFVDREFLHDGHFVWDGEGWYWCDAQHKEHPVRVQVLLDAGRAILVASHMTNLSATDQVRQFAWLQQGNMPLSWHGFRCAVYSRPMGDARPDGEAASPLKI